MRRTPKRPPVSICVLTYGEYLHLARRCIGSIRRFCDRSSYRLIVGANAVCPETCAYLEGLRAAGHIDDLLLSRKNINKCPMMRRMFRRVDTEFIWWFDDDSFIARHDVLPRLLRLARRSPPTTVMWGRLYVCSDPSVFGDLRQIVRFVRSSSWYGGLSPPSWDPGGKGEFNFQGRGTGDGRWFFATGGGWLIRTSAVRRLDWPDRRLVMRGEDMLLGEALRQQGWQCGEIGSIGLRVNRAVTRGERGPRVAVPRGGSRAAPSHAP